MSRSKWQILVFSIAGFGLVVVATYVGRLAFRDTRAGTKDELAQVFPELASLPGQHANIERGDDGRFWLFWVQQSESEQEQSAAELVEATWVPTADRGTYVKKYGPPKYRGNGHSELRIRRLPGGSLYAVLIDPQQNSPATSWNLLEAASERRASKR